MSGAVLPPVAVLGLGAMGSRMATRLLAAGHAVTVWNRTPAAAAPLQALGATVAATPRQAVAQTEVVLSMVRDDEASLAVWLGEPDGALAAMQAGAVAIECSTLSLPRAQTLAEAARSQGVTLLDAPVSGSRAQADAGQLLFLVGGDAPVFERVQPLLGVLGAGAQHVGPAGHGALAKLATNALLGLQVAALAELMPWLRQQGADVPRLLQALGRTSVWAPVGGYLAGSMLAGDHRPQFPVELMVKDLGYVAALAGEPADAPLLSAVRSVFQRGVAQGLGDQNMTAVARLYPGS